jgi:hypothetical protein
MQRKRMQRKPTRIKIQTEQQMNVAAVAIGKTEGRRLRRTAEPRPAHFPYK